MIQTKNLIGIVILNYNHATECINLIESIKHKLPNNYYYIIVDNNSKDIKTLVDYSIKNNYDIIKAENLSDLFIQKQVTLVGLNNNLGYAKGNNTGLKLLYMNNFQYAFILNPDILIEKVSVFENFVSFLRKKNNTAIASPQIILPDGKIQNHCKRIDFSTIFINFLFPVSELFISIFKWIELKLIGYKSIYSGIGCFYGINLQIMNIIGYFDEATFLYNEEQIIGEKIRKNGYKFLYLPSEKIIHNHDYNESPQNKQYYQESFDYYLNEYIRPNFLIKKLIISSIKYRNVISKKLKKILYS